MKALKDIAESVSYGITASACDSPVGPRFLRITDIQDGSVNWNAVPWCECDARSAEAAKLRRGDIVFARTGATTGKSFLISECPENAVFASYLIRLRLKNMADPAYVSHFFRSEDYWSQIAKNSRGAAQPGVNSTTLKSLRIPLPPLSEQKRIAGILDAADALRAKRRESLIQLDSLLQSTFLEMFGDPVTNPMAWEVKQLPDLVSSKKHALKRGPFGGALKKEIFVPDGFKVYEQKNVIYDDFEMGSYFIKQRDYDRLSAFKVAPNDLLVSCSGTIGRIAAVPTDAAPGVMNQALLKIQLDETRMLNPFFLGLWRSAPFEQHVLGMTHGTGMKNMKSMKELKGINFIAPPLRNQECFASIVDALDQQKTQRRTHLAELDVLFASLQHRAFRGEL